MGVSVLVNVGRSVTIARLPFPTTLSNVATRRLQNAKSSKLSLSRLIADPAGVLEANLSKHSEMRTAKCGMERETSLASCNAA